MHWSPKLKFENLESNRKLQECSRILWDLRFHRRKRLPRLLIEFFNENIINFTARVIPRSFWSSLRDSDRPGKSFINSTSPCNHHHQFLPGCPGSGDTWKSRMNSDMVLQAGMCILKYQKPRRNWLSQYPHCQPLKVHFSKTWRFFFKS